jgi:thiol-disulfide isomerase/thioredoxin
MRRTFCLAALAAAVGCAGKPPGPSAAGAGVQVAPADAVEAAIAAGKGKVVLVDCWATWCPPCVASFPKLVEEHRKYADRGLVVIGVSLDDPSDADKVSAFLARREATFTNFLLKSGGAAKSRLMDKLGFESAIPHAALFGRSGERVWAGYPADGELAERIAAELAK